MGVCRLQGDLASVVGWWCDCAYLLGVTEQDACHALRMELEQLRGDEEVACVLHLEWAL